MSKVALLHVIVILVSSETLKIKKESMHGTPWFQLLRLLPRSDTSHFCSHLISQSESHTSTCDVSRVENYNDPPGGVVNIYE